MWGILRRVFAAIGLVIAVLGFATFVTAAVGIWELKEEANRRTDALAVKAHRAVNAADRTVVFVRDVVKQGEQDLERARKTAKEEPQTPVNPFVQLSARQASEKLAGSVERANTAVTTASDAVVVAETALRLFEEDEQLKSWFSIQPEQLSRTQVDLTAASRELKNVRTILGIPIPKNDPPTTEQLRTVESALQQARSITDQMGDIVSRTRTRVDETKESVDRWVLRVAIGVTAVGVLGALGQLFMARFFWRVLRGKPA